MYSKRNKLLSILTIICFVLVNMNLVSFADNPPATQLSGNSSIQLDSDTVNGEYVISVRTDSGWAEAGSLAFKKNYEEKAIDLSSYIPAGSNALISIVQRGGGAAQVDSVSLSGAAPVKVNGSNDAFLFKKLSANDFDVTPVGEEGIQVEFPSHTTSFELKLAARIEPVVISKHPFQYPVSNNFKIIDNNSDFCKYTLNSNQGNLTLDGQLDEVYSSDPFFKSLCKPSTGHPDGFIYGWVMNDAQYLYVAMDVTPDNTMDGDEDYSKVYVKTASGVKEFKITLNNTQWGTPSFVYNNKVAYQHKVYEFKIPLSEIGIYDSSASSEISMAFSAYGTMAISPASATIIKSNPSNIEISSVIFNLSTLVSITNTDIPHTLEAGTDYTLSGSTLIINASYLSTLPYGDCNLELKNNTSTTELSLTVTDLKFQPKQTYPGLPDPNCITSGDFDGDDNMDFAVTNTSSNNVSVFLNVYGDVNVNTMPSMVLPTGSMPMGIANGDFNEDGLSDLAVVNNNSKTVSIHISKLNVDGSFQTASSLTTQDDPRNVAVGDFNNDSHKDIVVTNFGSNNITLFLGDGSGNFVKAGDIDAGNGPHGIAVGKFNNDSYDDVAVTNLTDNKVTILKGTSSNTLEVIQGFSVGQYPNSVAIADFDANGYVDIVTSNLNSNSLSLLMGMGDFSFDDASHISLSVSPSRVFTGYFNTDSLVDIGITSSTASSVTILTGRGNGTFLDGIQFNADAGAASTIPGDFNGDGKTDMAIVFETDNSLSILLNCSDDTQVDARIYCGTPEFDKAIPEDIVVNVTPNSRTLNANGVRLGMNSLIKDTDYIDNISNHNIVIISKDYLINLPSGKNTFTFDFDGGADQKLTIDIFAPSVPIAMSSANRFTAGNAPESVIAGDFNNDGKSDLAVANYSSNNISILLGNGNGTFQNKVDYLTGSRPYSAAIGDFNGDGKQDLAVANLQSDNISILTGNGDGTFNTKVDYTTGQSPQGIVIDDFNRDGKADIAVPCTNSNSVSVLIGLGDGTFQIYSYTTGTGPLAINAGDFNGDNRTDIVTANYDPNASTTQTISILFGNTSNTFDPKTDINTGSLSSVTCIEVQDFDNDEKLDLASVSYSDNLITVFLGNGNGTFDNGSNFSVGTAPKYAVAGDFNGDGNSDLAVANAIGSSISVLEGNGDGTFSNNLALFTGDTPHGVAFGDFNGDKKPDLVNTNCVDNDVSVFLNTTDYSVTDVDITTTALESVELNSCYSFRLFASGGSMNYLWKASGLPAGLTLNPYSGVISGTPSAAGNYSVSVTVSDYSSNTASATFNLNITQPAKTNPSIAYDPVNHRYLVVYTYNNGSAIMGQYYDDSSLSPVGTPFTIDESHNIHSKPSVKYLDGKYLVVWSAEYRLGYKRIYGGLFLAGDPAPTVSPFNIGDIENPDTSFKNQYDPVITADTRNKRFLVVWSEYYSLSFKIYSQILNSDGSDYNNTSDICIRSNGNPKSLPAAAFDSWSNDKFLIVWEEVLNGCCKITAQVLSSEGSIVSDSFIVSDVYGKNQTKPSIAFSLAKGKFLITWSEEGDSSPKLMGKVLIPSDIQGTPVQINTQTIPSSSSSTVTYDEKHHKFIIAWKGGADKISYRVMRRDNSFESAGDNTIMGNSSSVDYPKSAYNSNTGNIVVVFQDGPALKLSNITAIENNSTLSSYHTGHNKAYSNDFILTLRLNGNNLESICNGDTELAPSDDYAVTINEDIATVTFSYYSFLKDLAEGQYTFKFKFNNSTYDQELLLNIASHKVYVPVTSFIKSNPQDIRVTVNLGKANLQGIVKDSSWLQDGSNYTLLCSSTPFTDDGVILRKNDLTAAVTLRKDYLATLSTGTNSFSLVFKDGIVYEVTINIAQ